MIYIIYMYIHRESNCHQWTLFIHQNTSSVLGRRERERRARERKRRDERERRKSEKREREERGERERRGETPGERERERETLISTPAVLAVTLPWVAAAAALLGGLVARAVAVQLSLVSPLCYKSCVIEEHTLHKQ